MKNLLKNTTELAQAICTVYIREFKEERQRQAALYEAASDDENTAGSAKESEITDETAMNIVAIDATCGNGHDTLWLAKNCDKVYAFDIQPAAIDASEKLLAENNIPVHRRTAAKDENSKGNDATVELICDTHEKLKEYVNEPATLILFNLGYLPGSDKKVVTNAKSTLHALESATEILRLNGLLCVTIYQGHSEGKEEYSAVLEWAKGLDKGIYHCVHTDMINQPNFPPEILFVTKKR